MSVISVTGSAGDQGEFALIRRIIARLPQPGHVLVGPGDDAAVISTDDGRVVASTDLLVDGHHFRRDWSSGYDVGRRAAAANLADVVAMGARPSALLVGLALPRDTPLDWIDDLARGLQAECDRVGAGVVGGDLSSTATLTVAVTALGDLEGRAPVTRRGAVAGNLVVLAGRLGFAAAGLALLTAGYDNDPLTDAHRRPEVDYAAGLRLAGTATAMIDVSDGLLADVGHIATASGVAMELVASALPVDSAVARAARRLDVDPLSWVAGGGDDHAFVATVPADDAAGWQVIGRVVSGEPAVRFTDRDLPAVTGHEHFTDGG